MNAPVQTIHLTRRKAQPSGPRPVPPAALDSVQRVLVDADLTRRDLLIEHLHLLNDHFGQLRTDHLAALAELTRIQINI